MNYSKDFFGTRLTLKTPGVIPENILDICFGKVNNFEQKYSRFIHGNTLDTLNTKKTIEAEQEFLQILKLCLKVSEVSKGYFDITVRSLLENMGYGKEKEKGKENIGYENIEITNNTVTLKNDVSIEIGSVGKGYMIDIIFNILERYLETFTIDFGGDIRIKGKQRIGLEDPVDRNKIIGYIDIANGSLATSAGNKRRFGKNHHLLNAKTKKSEEGTIGVYVKHKNATIADIYATALFVTPTDIATQILEEKDELEGMMITKDGSIYKSNGFDCCFYKK